MFWTIVGALLFVFVGIPIILSITAGGIYALTRKTTWRILSSMTGFILIIIMAVNQFGEENGDNFGMIGMGALGLFLIYLGYIGSFSPKKWKEVLEAEIPLWFNGDEQQWSEFYKWNEMAFHHFYDYGRTSIFDRIPTWFSGNTDQWVEFQKWFKRYVRTHSPDLKQNNDTASNSAPEWFGGNKEQWIECRAWYAEFVTRSKDASRERQLKNLGLTTGENNFSSKTKTIISWALVIGALAVVIIFYQPRQQDKTKFVPTTSTSKTDFSEYGTPIAPADQRSYKYTLKSVTNVRSCGSLSCPVIGQYPTDTEFKFANPLSELPEWIEISWLDKNGKTQYGFIHKGALKIAASTGKFDFESFGEEMQQ